MVGVDQPGGPQGVNEPHYLNQLLLGPMLSSSACELYLSSAPYVFLSSVGAVPAPSTAPAAGSMGAPQTQVTVPCLLDEPYSDSVGSLAPVLSPD